MHRRNFLEKFGAGAMVFGSASIPAASKHSAKSCKVIGIGGAGCNAVSAFASSVDSQYAPIKAEFLCIDLGRQSLSNIEGIGQTAPRSLPVKTISLAPYGAGGRVNAARAAALSHIELLKTAVGDADAVLLVAGLGGGAGSGIAPIMARLARQAGAATVAAVVTPFDFEGVRRIEKAGTAIRHLEREADLVIQVSNHKLADAMGEDTLMDDLLIAQELRIGTCISAFLTRTS